MLNGAQDDARGQCSPALRTTRVGNAHRRSGRRAWAMLISAQDDAHGQCSSAPRTTRMGNAHQRPGRRAWAMLPEAVPLASWRTQLPATGWTVPKGSACSTTRRSRRLPRCLGLSSFMSYRRFGRTTRAFRFTRLGDVTLTAQISTRNAGDVEPMYEPHLKHETLRRDTRPWYCVAPSSPLIALQADSSTDKTHTHDTAEHLEHSDTRP
jgi:hypothetical protein